ncbi:MAG TPA: hypothetical protein DD387_05090 [Lachnoclostridium sp.]|nr:hypothetical protein DW922_14215 [Clostridium sp. AM42-4]HBM47181.1 hypothetical protein [Lachnoclostridium sp.]
MWQQILPIWNAKHRQNSVAGHACVNSNGKNLKNPAKSSEIALAKYGNSCKIEMMQKTRDMIMPLFFMKGVRKE